jgi:hypothetical protein
MPGCDRECRSGWHSSSTDNVSGWLASPVCKKEGEGKEALVAEVKGKEVWGAWEA